MSEIEPRGPTSEQWFVVYPDDEQQGPFTIQDLRERVSVGLLQPLDSVRLEGTEEVIPAAQIDGISAWPLPIPKFDVEGVPIIIIIMLIWVLPLAITIEALTTGFGSDLGTGSLLLIAASTWVVPIAISFAYKAIFRCMKTNFLGKWILFGLSFVWDGIVVASAMVVGAAMVVFFGLVAGALVAFAGNRLVQITFGEGFVLGEGIFYVLLITVYLVAIYFAVSNSIHLTAPGRARRKYFRKTIFRGSHVHHN